MSPFPNMAAARWQVSQQGGGEARWSEDGRELYYVTSNDELVVAKIKTSPEFAVLGTERLFNVSGFARDGGFHMYELEPHGKRFYMLRTESFPGLLLLS